MRDAFSPDDTLLQRLPLPLAQLYRRAHNAKTAHDRHLNAFSLWEAGLKLLAATAIVEYAQHGPADPELTQRLQSLTRPVLGHWWEFVRRLLPVLADQGDGDFQKVRDLVLGRTREDWPRAAGLDAALLEALDGQRAARATVRCTELFDRLVRYRNTFLAHGAPGGLKPDFLERMGAALLAGVAEVLAKLETLAGRRLVYIAEVRQVGGVWLVERYELAGERARRIASLELPRTEAARLPDGGRLYLETLPNRSSAPEHPEPSAPPLVPLSPCHLVSLHPLVLYEAEAEEVLFLNARRGRQRTEYLCYTTGRTADRPDLGTEQRALLARVLGMAVAEEQAGQWAARSHAEEPQDAPASEGCEAPGTRRLLGEFELLSELGRGGMGVVYRAWQPSLGRQVALKKLLHSGDARTEARFRREIHALGRVEHPHLVKIFTSGSDGEQWFYAMELVEGAALSAVCDKLQTRTASVTEVDLPAWQEALSTVCIAARKAEKPLSEPPPDQPAPGPAAASALGAGLPTPPRPRTDRSYVRHIARLMHQMAEAAHALHEAGVLHRDIKPGNILVPSGGGHAVLMDLGLAQLADATEGRVTRTRQFVGTLRYASPEQVLAVGTLDRRSDVYSLGATLWELLTLRPLFGATEQTPTPELMQRIQIEEPGRVRKHNPGVGRDLEAMVEKCLQKDPWQRYGTARELADDLGRFLEGRPVRARRVSGLERGWKWAKRRPALAALVAVVVLGTIGLLAGGVWFTWKLDQARRDAESHAKKEERLRKRADAHAQSEEGLRKEAEKQKMVAQKEAEKRAKAEKKYSDEAERLAVVTGHAADNAWEAGYADQARHFLEEIPEEFRAWEWRYRQRRFQGSYLTLYGHTLSVTAVAFSPDGQRLASASWDQTVKLWQAQTGQPLRTLRGHANALMAVFFSPDGRRLFSPQIKGKTLVWDVQTGTRLPTPQAPIFFPGKRVAGTPPVQSWPWPRET